MISILPFCVLNCHMELTNRLPHSQRNFTDHTVLIFIPLRILSGAYNIYLSQPHFKSKKIIFSNTVVSLKVGDTRALSYQWWYYSLSSLPSTVSQALLLSCSEDGCCCFRSMFTGGGVGSERTPLQMVWVSFSVKKRF